MTEEMRENNAEEAVKENASMSVGEACSDCGEENVEAVEAATPEKACEVLAKMLDLLSINAKVHDIPAAGGFRLAVESEDAGRLIGKKGQTLENLELVFNRVLSNLSDKGRTGWITIEVDGYSVPVPLSEAPRSGKLPREEITRLEHLALDIAKEVKKLHKPRVIGPYSPSERRIIHLALEKDPEIETVSDAEADANRGKKITVRLKDNA